MQSVRPSPFYPWFIWSLGAGFFFAEYFARVSPAVMVPQLMQAFSITALGMGSMSAFFYYAYVSMQIPVGTLVDRFKPHRLLTVMAALCACSCFLFASTRHLEIAYLARLLMGFSAAFAFVGALKLANVWFPPERFGLLAGLTQALGMLGAAVGGGPLALSVHAVGWRATLVMIGGILVVLAGLIALSGRRKVSALHETPAAVQSFQMIWQGLKIVLRNSQTWWNAVFVGLLYAPTAAFAELWGVYFLQQTRHLQPAMAATAVSVIFIGWAIGGPLTGWFSDRIKRRRPVMIASVSTSLILIISILYLPQVSTQILFLLLFLYGMANTGVATAYVVAAEINPRAVAGTSMAFANMASVLIGAALQPLIGWFLDLQWQGQVINGAPIYSAQAFHWAMLALPLCLVVGLLVAFKIKESFR